MCGIGGDTTGTSRGRNAPGRTKTKPAAHERKAKARICAFAKNAPAVIRRQPMIAYVPDTVISATWNVGLTTDELKIRSVPTR